MPTQPQRHTTWSYKWDDGAATVIETKTGRTVAYIYPTPQVDSEHELAAQIAREHNAHAALLEALQAALPTLIEAVEKWSNGDDCYAQELKQARAAIAAATGEGN